MKHRFNPLEAQLRSQGIFLIAGIDEAGRGPLAGPVVSAAVILKKGARLPGLNDSKKLSATKREKLFQQIINQSLDYSITAVSAKFIDQHNILIATQVANDLCISGLKTKPEIVLIDGRDKQMIDLPFKTIIKGDQKIRTIAAASILAKVTRDKIMQYYSKQFPQYHFQKHMGYGTRLHRQTIAKYGKSSVHRQSFKLKTSL